MSAFDTFVMVDWSSGNDTGPTPRADAVWSCVARGAVTSAPIYHRNRQEAEAWLTTFLAGEVQAGRRVLAGFDFPFGYPSGFAEVLTGKDDPLALWDWFAEHLDDAPKANNRFDLAGQINGRFPGTGPFWFNALKRDIEGLPRKGTARVGHGMSERRAAEDAAPGAFACWQMGGTGAVGGQVMTGIAMLSRLRAALPGTCRAWPFQALDAPVALVEVWPSLIADVVREAVAETKEIKDAAQVRLLARAMSGLAPDDLQKMLDDTPEAACQEGWIFGLGHEATLAASARAPLAPPKLENDCFALPSGVDWLPVDDALDLLRQNLRPVVRAETISTGDALGRVLAQDHLAARAHPPGANAAVDGYGFAHAATGAGPQNLPLVQGRAAAGAPHAGTVPEGSAIRILTGALLPDGVDTVVLEEDCASDGAHVAFDGPVRKGTNARAKGEDVGAGATALPQGRTLTPADLALLSALGVSKARVFSRLRVGVLSTGDEIAPPTPGAPPSVTFDANRPMLLGMAARMGYTPVDLGHVGDDRTALRARLDEAATQADVILTSGGASAGDEDHVSALLRQAGALQAWRIAIKPGRPLALGLWQGVPVFGLPGNPVAAFVCTLIFARPAFQALSGAELSAPQAVTVPAAFKKSKKPGRREYLRARLNDQGHAEVFPSEGSGRVSGLSWATGLVELPDGAMQIEPGTPVHFLPFGSFGL